jgi:DNA-binding transcriptional ArsR family regulator
MLELLRDGPSTASKLARALGESSGATSYHLRALAKAELVGEEPGRGNGRERWWRRRSDMLLIPTSKEDPELRAAGTRLLSVYLDRDEEALRRYLRGESDLDETWVAAKFIGGWHAWATPEEVDELGQRIAALIDEFRGPERSGATGARQIYVTFRAIPWLEPAE